MKVGDSGLGVKVFLALMFLYATYVAVNWCWNKIKSKMNKNESR